MQPITPLIGQHASESQQARTLEGFAERRCAVPVVLTTRMTFCRWVEDYVCGRLSALRYALAGLLIFTDIARLFHCVVQIDKTAGGLLRVSEEEEIIVGILSCARDR